jgi:hypothetical protein
LRSCGLSDDSRSPDTVSHQRSDGPKAMSDDLEDESHLPSLDDRLIELRPELEELRKRLVPKIGIQEVPDAKVLWKVLVLYQSLIRRTLYLVEGVGRAWRHEEYLTAIVLARCITETAAFIWDLTTGLRTHVRNADLDAIDKLVMARTYGSRLIDDLPPAVNILTLIEKFDRDLMANAGVSKERAREKVVRAHYDLLSEFAHPNYFGVTNLFGDLDRDQRTVFFGKPSLTDQQRIGRTLGVSMSAIFIVEACARMLDEFAEPLRQLNKQKHPPPIA